MRAAPLLLAVALGLSACAEPTVRPSAPDDALAEGVMPDASQFLEQEAMSPAPTLPAPPPPLDSALAARIARVDTTAVPGAGIFDDVGVLHGGEAPASDGEEWLGLYPTASGWELAAVTVRVRTVPDPLFSSADEPEDPPTGVEVTTDRTVRTPSSRPNDPDWLQDDALMFLRADALEPGPVTTAFSGAWPLKAGSSLSVRLPADGGGGRLEAVAIDGRPYELLLELDGLPVLHHVDRDAGYAGVLWAGDLDRDGALDLVLDASPHYNMSNPQLWLSSAADDGAPLGLVAEHVTTGC